MDLQITSPTLKGKCRLQILKVGSVLLHHEGHPCSSCPISDRIGKVDYKTFIQLALCARALLQVYKFWVGVVVGVITKMDFGLGIGE